jgi:phage terminase large subunit GpA-like protein
MTVQANVWSIGTLRYVQICPHCGLEEAAGSYCTYCGTRTDESHQRPHRQGEVSPSRKRQQSSKDALNRGSWKKGRLSALKLKTRRYGSIGCLPEVA